MIDYFQGDTRTNRERMLAGDYYTVEDPELLAELTRANQLAKRYSEIFLDEPEAARAILEELLGSIAPDAYIRGPLYVDYGKHITVGPRTFINCGLTALDVAPITIGADVQIGPNVQLLTPVHPIEPELRRAKLERAEPITIGDNVWLGGGVIVLPGVTIGDDTVVGAGAVVTKDLPPGVVAVGNPARVIRRI